MKRSELKQLIKLCIIQLISDDRQVKKYQDKLLRRYFGGFLPKLFVLKKLNILSDNIIVLYVYNKFKNERIKVTIKTKPDVSVEIYYEGKAPIIARIRDIKHLELSSKDTKSFPVPIIKLRPFLDQNYFPKEIKKIMNYNNKTNVD